MTARRDIEAITERIRQRSKAGRDAYLGRIAGASSRTANRAVLGCGNLAHGFAVCSPSEKIALGGDRVPNLGIITSYNDMLSAHQPFETFPALIKEAAREAGGIAQVAGGVPAMCDGVTQGQPGMELSLFSRDVIAMAAASPFFGKAFRHAFAKARRCTGDDSDLVFQTHGFPAHLDFLVVLSAAFILSADAAGIATKPTAGNVSPRRVALKPILATRIKSLSCCMPASQNRGALSCDMHWLSSYSRSMVRPRTRCGSQGLPTSLPVVRVSGRHVDRRNSRRLVLPVTPWHWKI